MKQTSKKKNILSRMKMIIFPITGEGLLLMLASTGYLIYVISVYLRFKQLLEDSQNDVMIYKESVDLIYNPMLFAVSILVMIYISLHLTLGLYVRRQFQNAFVNGKFSTNSSGTSISFQTNLNPFLLLLNARVTLNIVSETLNEIDLDKALYPYTYFTNGVISFNTTSLPSGNYKVESITLALIDTFSTLNLQSIIKLPSTHLFQVDKFFRIHADLSSSSDYEEEQGDSLIYTKPDELSQTTREYRSGDSLRKIHWKNSAKHRKYFVKLPEERYVNKTKMSVYINFFLPNFKNLKIENIIGDYISIVLEIVEQLANNQTKSIDLIINSKDIINIELNDSTDVDSVRKRILKEASLQSKRKIAEIVERKSASNSYLISLPLDDSITHLNFSQCFIFNFKGYPEFNVYKNFMKKMLKYEENKINSDKGISRFLNGVRRHSETLRLHRLLEKQLDVLRNNPNTIFINAKK